MVRGGWESLRSIGGTKGRLGNRPPIPYISLASEEPGECPGGLLGVESRETLLLDYRLVVVDVVAVLVALSPVIVVGRAVP